MFKKFFLLVVFGLFSLLSFAKSPADWFDAARFGDTWKMSSMMFAGTAINTADANGNTALHKAMVEPNEASVQWLIRQPGIDLNARNAVGETALMQAIIHGYDAIAMALLRAGAAVNQTGWTPLHYAAASKAPTAPAYVQLLLDKYSAYVDAESPNGTTPLMMAARYGLTASVQALLDGGADLTLKNQQGLTAFDFAQNSEHPDSTALVKQAYFKLMRERAAERARANAAAPTEPQALPPQVMRIQGGNKPVEFETIPKGQW